MGDAMTNFSLLSALKNAPEPKKLKESSIQYDEYVVTLHNNKEKTVFIPVRESEDFESALSSELLITEGVIRSLLRKHNGVTEV